MVTLAIGTAMGLAALASAAFGQASDSSVGSPSATPAAPPHATSATSDTGSLPPLAAVDIVFHQRKDAPHLARYYP
jgi:hypothetical protein